MANTEDASKKLQTGKNSDESTLYIVPRKGSDSKSMPVLYMSSNGIKSLLNGNHAMSYIREYREIPIKPIYLTPTSLRALCAFIPTVDKAVREHEKTSTVKIKKLMFPHDDFDAYRRIFGWIFASIEAGEVLTFEVGSWFSEEFKKSLLRIARKLGMGKLERDLITAREKLNSTGLKKKG